MKARTPDTTGTVIRDGVAIHYDVYGNGPRTILLVPTWSIVHSEVWKGQVAALPDAYRVITYDGRGNGRSGRPKGPEHYRVTEFVADALAVLDATGTERCVVVGLSFSGHVASMIASWHPERVDGAVLFAPSAPFGPRNPYMTPDHFLGPMPEEEGWATFNRKYWLERFHDFAAFFMSRVFVEPHSSKQIEDGIAYAKGTDGPTIVDTILARRPQPNEMEDAYRAIRCPVLVVHGDRDEVMPLGKGKLVTELTRGRLEVIANAGHGIPARFPVKSNRLIRDFVDGLDRRAASAPTAGKAPSLVRRTGSTPRVLYLSSPIGLGHARRDRAIADNLRALCPGAEIHWLAQDPVTRFLDRAGECVHPASSRLKSESGHFKAEAGEHDLDCFEALRRMDEIMVANFSVFQDVLEADPYDVVIADEAWDVDFFWHEHPELKRAKLAWMTDFVGILPMPEGGERQAVLAADYNAEMIGHVERHRHVRDRAIFVGSPEDVVERPFGPGLPDIRTWTTHHYAFSGYIGGYDPADLGDRAILRARLGYRPEETVVIAAVGGSGVGTGLLRRILEAVPTMVRRLPSLRLVAVAGPRIDPASLPRPEGAEVHAFVPELHEHLAACDLALVQGGLTTCMELTAAGRPFLYFPLRGHFEQNIHVRHRLDRYGAGLCMDYAAAADPEALAEAVATTLAVPPASQPVETDGALRAARLIADLF